jgi:tryptophan-rich sensory protein
MDAALWYAQLKKPAWAPPPWLFSPVWTFLYIIIAASFGFVFYKAFTNALPVYVALPFILNLVFNFAFTPIQFGLRNNFLATLDIVLILGTLIWALLAVYPFYMWVAYANVPYLAWVCFATILQCTITYLNR